MEAFFDSLNFWQAMYLMMGFFVSFLLLGMIGIHEKSDIRPYSDMFHVNLDKRPTMFEVACITILVFFVWLPWLIVLVTVLFLNRHNPKQNIYYD